MNTKARLCIGRVEKAFAEYLGGSRVKYTRPCGHAFTETVMVGPKGPGSRGLRKPMNAEMLAKLARYWGQRHDDGTPMFNFNVGPCSTCVRIAKKMDPKLVAHLKRRRD